MFHGFSPRRTPGKASRRIEFDCRPGGWIIPGWLVAAQCGNCSVDFATIESNATSISFSAYHEPFRSSESTPRTDIFTSSPAVAARLISTRGVFFLSIRFDGYRSFECGHHLRALRRQMARTDSSSTAGPDLKLEGELLLNLITRHPDQSCLEATVVWLNAVDLSPNHVRLSVPRQRWMSGAGSVLD